MEKACAETMPSSAAQRWRYWLPVVAYTSLIFYLSSLPHPEDTLPNFLFEQLGAKLLHAAEYAVLAFLCYRAFLHAAGPRAASNALILAIGAASLFGMTDEVHQAFVPSRESSWSDWIADTAGAVVGAAGLHRFVKRGTKHDIS